MFLILFKQLLNTVGWVYTAIAHVTLHVHVHVCTCLHVHFVRVHLYRELKRLSTVTLSPVYAHFSESLSGLTTIRALRASERFATENETRLELNQRANFGSEWLCFDVEPQLLTTRGHAVFTCFLDTY